MNDKAKFFTTTDALVMLRTVVFCLWPVTTLAAGQSLGDALYGVGFKDWIALLLLTNVSGLVALLTRVRRSLEAAAKQAAGQSVDQADRQLIPWWFFALIHMLGAMFVGACTFFIGEWLDLNSYLEALAIALTSWGGAKYVDKWADALSDGFVNKLTAVIGRNEN